MARAALPPADRQYRRYPVTSFVGGRAVARWSGLVIWVNRHAVAFSIASNYTRFSARDFCDVSEAVILMSLSLGSGCGCDSEQK